MAGSFLKRYTMYRLLFVDRPPASRETEEELVLRLNPEDLFDRVVMLPHAELNDAVYNAVDQFVDRYDGSRLKLTILGCSVNEATQDTFREVYRAHYSDEHEKVARYLHRRYIRIIVLMMISIIAFNVAMHLFSISDDHNFVKEVISEVCIFCIWEIGYTHFDRLESVEEMTRITRARDAEIHFE